MMMELVVPKELGKSEPALSLIMISPNCPVQRRTTLKITHNSHARKRRVERVQIAISSGMRSAWRSHQLIRRFKIQLQTKKLSLPREGLRIRLLVQMPMHYTL
jgi:hypothetical protein